MKSLKSTLENLILQLELGQSESEVYHQLINLIHSKYKDKMLPLFLRIQQLEVDRIKEEKLVLYKGVEESMHNTSSLAKHLLEDKTSKQAKDFAKYLFENFEGNIAMLINTMKSYFPNGTSEGTSNNGKWFYDKFVELLTKNKTKYLPGGSSYDWVQMFNHEEYINLILKENLQDN